MNQPGFFAERRVALKDPAVDPHAYQTAEFVGKIALCGKGRLGRIEGRSYCSFREWAWVGTGLDGSAWASTRPRVLCDADQAAVVHLFAEVPLSVPPSDGPT